jgi:hypothetical protein
MRAYFVLFIPLEDDWSVLPLDGKQPLLIAVEDATRASGFLMYQYLYQGVSPSREGNAQDWHSQIRRKDRKSNSNNTQTRSCKLWSACTSMGRFDAHKV